MFFTDNADIYIDDGANFRVDKLSLNTNENTPVMNISGSCLGVFVDIEDNLYCSMHNFNQVVNKILEE
jgi:hypothetical protein